MDSDAPVIVPNLEQLVVLFYPALSDLGKFEPVDVEQMPTCYRNLLAHENHMTVTVEQHHGGAVEVKVLEKQQTQSHYARKILLCLEKNRHVVQFGIMRVSFDLLTDAVRREIESEGTPLGRILIRHNVLRQVELAALWRVTPGEELRDLLSMSHDQTTYGRTALIHVDGKPAVELLEIVAAED